jgi:hypothetical protein
MDSDGTHVVTGDTAAEVEHKLAVLRAREHQVIEAAKIAG